MLDNHHYIDQNTSFLGKYFFLLVIRSAYEQEFDAPVTVPFNRKRFCELNLELLHFKQISRSSNIQSADGDIFVLVSKAFLTTAISLPLSMIGYMFTISKETKIVLSRIISTFSSLVI